MKLIQWSWILQNCNIYFAPARRTNQPLVAQSELFLFVLTWIIFLIYTYYVDESRKFISRHELLSKTK